MRHTRHPGSYPTSRVLEVPRLSHSKSNITHVPRQTRHLRSLCSLRNEVEVFQKRRRLWCPTSVTTLAQVRASTGLSLWYSLLL